MTYNDIQGVFSVDEDNFASRVTTRTGQLSRHCNNQSINQSINQSPINCMTSWVVLRHLGTDTLGGSLGGGSFVVKVDIDWNRILTDENT